MEECIYVFFDVVYCFIVTLHAS